MKKIFNFLTSSTLKHIILLIFLFTCYIFLSASHYVNGVSSDLANSVFRLHVIANSDSKEDQNLKYKVRDRLLETMNQLTKDAHSKEEVIRIAQEHQAEFQKIAEEVVQENGFSYDISVKIGNFYFPTKNYGDISLPAGKYDALRIEIGNASGKNWWCVMFPPLCFVDISTGIVPNESKEYMKENLNEEEFSIISTGNNSNSNDSTIKFKFKLLEFFGEHNVLTAKE